MSAYSTSTALPLRNLGAWFLQGLLAGVFFAAGVTQLAAVPAEVHLFAQIGLGQWLRLVTGLFEIAGALALIHPRFAILGGLWLGFSMLWVIAADVAILHASPTPAILVAFANLLVVVLRRDELALLARASLSSREGPPSATRIRASR